MTVDVLLYGLDEPWDLGTWHKTGLTTPEEAFALYGDNSYRVGVSGWRYVERTDHA